MNKKYLFYLGLLFFASFAKAQSIKNIKATAKGTTVTIVYDLIASEQGQKFNIEIKSSNDNFSTALEKVTGNIGKDQRGGINKKILWSPLKEYGSFKGDISFQIIATVIPLPLKFIKPAESTSLKSNKNYVIKWKGGFIDNYLTLELLENGKKIMHIGTIKNTASYTWKVPKTITNKSKVYQFKLTDSVNSEDTTLSGKFNIKKTPLWLYVGAGVVVVIAAVLVAVLSGKTKGGTEKENGSPLPPPPIPPS